MASWLLLRIPNDDLLPIDVDDGLGNDVEVDIKHVWLLCQLIAMLLLLLLLLL
jgi:hypothetical protein